MRSGKAAVSCLPCSKRKVRCDKQLPCCHCKRRPQDSCEYPVSSPGGRAEEDLNERVAQLERYIRNLGGDPSEAPSQTSSNNLCLPLPKGGLEPGLRASRVNKPPGDAPGLLAHNEEATYIESPMWYSWGESKHDEESISGTAAGRLSLAFPTAANVGYAPTILDPIEATQHNFSDMSSIPSVDFIVIWKIFLKNVHPLVKIFFDWEVEPLIRKASRSAPDLMLPEKSLINAIAFLAVKSVPQGECVSLLQEEKHVLLNRLQRSTEKALMLVGYATTSNKLIVQAFMLYLQAMYDRAHPAAMFSLMGIANRIAERMGLHRDGQLLGLSVLRSEERRRMWWQLQYMELTAANHVGAMSSSVFGKWDAKPPANLDDHQLSPETKSLPDESSGLTSMSNCLWKYYTLQMHRELRWASDSSQPWQAANSMIDNIEEALRVRFVQHCGLLDPLHVNLQLGICQVILAARRAVRQPSLVNAKISDMSHRERNELLDICVKNLEYCVLLQTNELIKGYLWQNERFFPWAAFVYVILEANHRCEEDAAKEIWNLIRRTYATHIDLRTSIHRPDVRFSARITVNAWQKYAATSRRPNDMNSEEPSEWILELCSTFDIPYPIATSGKANAEITGTDQPFDFDFDLDMVDWSAWDKAYLDPTQFTTPS